MLFFRAISRYSALRGYMKVEEICKRFKNNLYEYVCICDYESYSGYIELQSICNKESLKAIYGITIKVQYKGNIGNCDVIFKNYNGYISFVQEYNKKIFEKVQKQREPNIIFDIYTLINMPNIIVLLGGINNIYLKLIDNNEEKDFVEQIIYSQKSTKNLYICISNISNINENKIKKSVYSMLEKGFILKDIIVYSQATVHPNSKQFNVNIVLSSIRLHKQISEIGEHEYYDGNYYIYNYKTYIDIVSKDRYFHEFIQNSYRLISSISKFEIVTNNKKDNFTRIIEKARDRIITYSKKRLHSIVNIHNKLSQQYQKRFEYEISIYDKIDIYSTLYIVHDFMKHARNNQIPIGPGRGSCVGSLVCYLLEITDVDPIQHNLIFERFLNEHRLSMPDIDIDVCNHSRKQLLDYIYNKYNKINSLNVIHIIAFLQMTFKSGFKDIAKSLGIFKFKESNYITSSEDINNNIEHLNKQAQKIQNIVKLASEKNIGQTIKHIHKIIREFKSNYIIRERIIEDLSKSQTLDDINRSSQSICNTILSKANGIQKCLKISSLTESCIKSTGVHAAGILISNKNLITTFPLGYGSLNNSEYVVVSQFNLNQLSEINIMKFDILGLESLTVIKESISELIQQGYKVNTRYKEIINYSYIYNIAHKGFTKGIFQLDKYKVAKISNKFKVCKFDDIVAITAINRPGAIDMVDQYVENKQNKAWILESKKLKIYEIVKSTRGLMLFQEQIMYASMIMANYTASQADILRHAIGKKKLNIVLDMKQDFVNKAIKNNYTESEAINMFGIIEKFTGYSFNKSHAVAYSYITAMTLYLKSINTQIFLSNWLNHRIKHKSKIKRLLIELVQTSYIYLDIGNSKQIYHKFKLSHKHILKLQIPIQSIIGIGDSCAEKLQRKIKNNIYSAIAYTKLNSRCILELKKLGFFENKNIEEINKNIKLSNINQQSKYNFNVFENINSNNDIESQNPKELIEFEYKNLSFSYFKLNMIYIFKMIINDIYHNLLFIIEDKFNQDICAINLISPINKIRSQYYKNIKGNIYDLIYVSKYEDETYNITENIIYNNFNVTKEIYSIILNNICIYHNGRYKNQYSVNNYIENNIHVCIVNTKHININTILNYMRNNIIYKISKQQLITVDHSIE